MRSFLQDDQSGIPGRTALNGIMCIRLHIHIEEGLTSLPVGRQ